MVCSFCSWCPVALHAKTLATLVESRTSRREPLIRADARRHDVWSQRPKTFLSLRWTIKQVAATCKCVKATFRDCNCRQCKTADCSMLLRRDVIKCITMGVVVMRWRNTRSCMRTKPAQEKKEREQGWRAREVATIDRTERARPSILKHLESFCSNDWYSCLSFWSCFIIKDFSCIHADCSAWRRASCCFNCSCCNCNPILALCNSFWIETIVFKCSSACNEAAAAIPFVTTSSALWSSNRDKHWSHSCFTVCICLECSRAVSSIRIWRIASNLAVKDPISSRWMPAMSLQKGTSCYKEQLKIVKTKLRDWNIELFPLKLEVTSRLML